MPPSVDAAAMRNFGRVCTGRIGLQWVDTVEKVLVIFGEQ
jgi:hypothetical protein